MTSADSPLDRPGPDAPGSNRPLGRPVPRTGPPIPRPGSPTAASTTISGTVTEGVEPGCIVLVDDAGAVVANLQGWDLRAHPFDSRVEVTGTFQPGLMTTCQQGTPFEVTAVRAG